MMTPEGRACLRLRAGLGRSCWSSLRSCRLKAFLCVRTCK